MKPLLVCFLASFCLAGPVVAQRLDWKPEDFVPLTSLPWKTSGADMREVLEVIFREPDPEIRYPVLAEYFQRVVPSSRLAEAFDLCLKLEGTQRPNDLVGLQIQLWGKREPEQALAKVRELVECVLLEGHPLHLDQWDGPPLKVVNLEAFRASPFWLSGQSLGGLGAALADAGRPKEIRNRMMREYAGLFIDRLGCLPDAKSTAYTTVNWEVVQVLDLPAETLRGRVRGVNKQERSGALFRAGVARMLQLQPDLAADWLEILEGTPDRHAHLVLWAKLDLPGMLNWTVARLAEMPGRDLDAQGLLLSRVEEPLRRKWLDEASRETEQHKNYLGGLLDEWARNDPRAALEEAAKSENADVICHVAGRAVYGVGSLYNASHFGLGVIRDFRLEPFLKAMSKDSVQSIAWEWGYTEMEQWLEVDTGEAARYGVEFLNRFPEAKLFPREAFIRLLTGDDGSASDSDMIDRTLCALRFWAMWKPKEMRKWIASLNDPELQKALTWTLENPWGQRAETAR